MLRFEHSSAHVTYKPQKEKSVKYSGVNNNQVNNNKNVVCKNPILRRLTMKDQANCGPILSQISINNINNMSATSQNDILS